MMVGINEKQDDKRVWGWGTYHPSGPLFWSYHASQKNKILTTLTSILLSFDLMKSEVDKREKNGKKLVS